MVRGTSQGMLPASGLLKELGDLCSCDLLGGGCSLKGTDHLIHIQKNDKLQGSGWQGLPPGPHGYPVESLSETETQTPPLELLKKVFIP